MSDYMFMLESHLNGDHNRVVNAVTGLANEANVNLYLTGGAVRDMLGGFAIRDLNFNGVPDNEPGLAGMTLTLRNASSLVIASTTTNSTGAFSFSGLTSGSYTLTATPPIGLFSTNALPGQGGVRVNAATISVTTTFGITNYPGQLFLAGP